MEPWRRGGSKWNLKGSVGQMVAYPGYFDEDQDPHQSEKLNPDLVPDPRQC
jgi:hypothetical protein